MSGAEQILIIDRTSRLRRWEIEINVFGIQRINFEFHFCWIFFGPLYSIFPFQDILLMLSFQGSTSMSPSSIYYIFDYIFEKKNRRRKISNRRELVDFRIHLRRCPWRFAKIILWKWGAIQNGFDLLIDNSEMVYPNESTILVLENVR